MADRWMLSRAGITNVYQYSDEILNFAGGRLLLRGVNGSGKSTAMNMLLPFLLDANTRRIDAAGEQSSVLRSWMLSGREEQQPVGYLWIEFERDDEHFVCGCGIRANRSTDRVTTWWFITPRRPGIDLALVEGRVPLSIDALRAELGAHAVFTHDQRAAYRSEVQGRLFAGADLDQHIRLLHVVRNPRVGDRIDVDLPTYLEDALPQLSDAAIEDAAQPLEDLEEHRRNVEDMGRTAAALDALQRVYQDYARAELARRASVLVERSKAVRDRRRHETQVRDNAETADVALRNSRETVQNHEADERRLREEIAALKEAPAYQAGQSLENDRQVVRTMEEAVATAGDRQQLASAARSTAARRVVAAGHTFDADSKAVATELSDLAALAASARLTVVVPDAPAPTTEPPGTGKNRDSEPVRVPAGRFDVERSMRSLSEVRAAANSRRGDVAQIRTALAAVDDLEQALRRAESDLEWADAEVGTAETRFIQARELLASSREHWQGLLRDWVQDFADERRGVGNDGSVVDAGVASADIAIAGIDDIDLELAHLDVEHVEITNRLLEAADALVDHHHRVAAEFRSRHHREQDVVDELEAERLELEQRTYADPPAAAWQRAAAGPRLAELIDFNTSLDDQQRAGLEAAMEAAGLLGAALETDGSLRLASGQLVVAASTQTDFPLSELLVVTIPAEAEADVDASLLVKVLDSISTSTTVDASTVVTTDGSFRVGLLHGRHTKDIAEHIGVTARRAAIERQRQDLEVRLTEGRAALELTDQELRRCSERIARATSIRQRIPSGNGLIEATERSRLAEERLGEAHDLLDRQREVLTAAEAAHADAESECRRRAATFALPGDRAGLDEVDRVLGQVGPACDRISATLNSMHRSHQHWADAATQWQSTITAERAAEREHRQAADAYEPMAMRLATLEDSIGLEFAELLATLEISTRDLEATTARLSDARDTVESGVGEHARLTNELTRAVEDREAAERHCVDGLPLLREALDVPGLVTAAVADLDSGAGDDAPDSPADPVAFPPVVETPEGTRQLADAVLATVPAPDREATTAESVRQSLRQRRDSLGSGWDAEDHQRSETLPLFIEVTGPLGRMPLADARREVAIQLGHQSSLLTAKQDQALRNLLQGMIAREVAEKLHAAHELVKLMNQRLDTVTTSHGIGAGLRWRRKAELDADLAATIDILAKSPDLRTVDENHALAAALSNRIDDARRTDPELPYRQLIGDVLDYRRWHQMSVLIRRPGQPEERLTRRTPLSEGEKKMVSYLPLFAAVAASCDALAGDAPGAPRFVLLDDAFAKVSEDNHAGLFGLLVDMDLDFIATSERLWGTHATVPELAITEVIRDASLGVILLEHSRWNGRTHTLS